MFGLSWFEIAFVLGIAFLIYGPEQFPVILKKLIGYIKEIKKYSYQAQQSFNKFSSDLDAELNPTNWLDSSQPKDQVGESEEELGENKDEDNVDDDLSSYEEQPYDLFLDEKGLEKEKVDDFESSPLDKKEICSDLVSM
ncbi:MAG: twin-arginine translocase TatA/TatE family subunit [Planctomycetes bacterium]|nr:twin-arginine translocase TatA/TatE family subunit [Planctomycetota bacterium]